MKPVMWRAQPPLVGRGRELSTLVGLLEYARDGQSGIAFVVGEPGVGKTRLLLELAQQARRDDWQVLFGHAYESEGMPPYLPFIEALREHARAARVTPGPELARLLPDLATGHSSPAPGLEPRDPEGQRYRLFEAVCDVLFEIAASSPRGLLLCLDDLHWADPPTLQLLVHLARKLDDAPLVLVCSYRGTAARHSKALTDALAELNRAHACQLVVVNPLSRDELDGLVLELAGAASPATLDLLYRQTGGNPFFVYELVRHLLDHAHDLTRSDVEPAEWGVPDSVNQVIGQRLSGLSDAANQLLQVGAIVGDALTLQVLGAVLELAPLPLVDALEEALGSGLLREVGDRYQFEHALVRQAVQQGMSAARKKHLHLAVAAAIERVYAPALDPHVSELAFHFMRAGDLAPADRTLAYAERAGDAANAVFAYAEAVAHWRLALQQMDRQAVAADQRARLLTRLGDLMYLAGIDYAAGITYLEQALRLLEEGGQTDRVAYVNLLLGQALSALPETWDLPRAMDHYRRAEAILKEGPRDAALGFVYAGLAQLAIWEVRVTDGLDASARALAIADRVGDDGLWARAAMTRGGHLCSSGRIGAGLDLMHEAWRVADRLNDPAVFLVAFLGSAFAHWIGDVREFRRWSERELARPRVRHAPGQRNRLLARLASAHALSGHLAAARALVDEVGPSYDAWDALFWLGEWPVCESLARARIESSLAGGERAFGFEAAYDLARLRRVQGDLDASTELLSLALSVATEGGEHAYELAVRTLLALVHIEAGQPPAAHQELERARLIAANNEDWRGLAGQLSLAEGALALASGREDTDQHFERSLATYHRHASPLAQAEVHLVWSRGLRHAGRASAAAAKLRAAADIYREHGASEVWLARLDGGADAYPDGLSEREVEVLQLVAAGRTNRQIADELVISINTVARHVTHIFEKAGVANRAEAASYALRKSLDHQSL